MKAAVYYETGAPEVFRYEDVPDPQVGPGDVLIDVEAVSIEGGDTLNRQGGALATRPHIVGYQAAGEIIEVGSEVTNLKIGQKVATTNAFGSHAELRSVPARNAWVIPDGFDVKLASVMPVAFGTADDCLFEFGHLKAGQTVLVQAGGSGVGTAAIQLAKRAGASSTGAPLCRRCTTEPSAPSATCSAASGSVGNSTVTVTDSAAGCSTSRTMRWPVWAVERQLTRRRALPGT